MCLVVFGVRCKVVVALWWCTPRVSGIDGLDTPRFGGISGLDVGVVERCSDFVFPGPCWKWSAPETMVVLVVFCDSYVCKCDVELWYVCDNTFDKVPRRAMWLRAYVAVKMFVVVMVPCLLTPV